ncbi:hypothetical protein L2E82_18769 [Cichorium intybus]|uniref:Uncharacterized protein n=1 Tax=Cichorium intybus TaxID=13427 RepID=A0ACB9FAV2_CICIN|nr:hypothetical protein L2E82_18769 [Cichorium intybus]
MSSSVFPSTGDHSFFTGYLDDIFSDFQPQSQLFFSSGSDNSTQKPNGSISGSDDGETNQWEVTLLIDERRKKRKISNRESARRSRVRKQKHLENLKNQVTRYKTGNQELINRLRFVNHNGQMLQRENERLRSASVMLQQTLTNLHQLLVVPELHHQNLRFCRAMQL